MEGLQLKDLASREKKASNKMKQSKTATTNIEQQLFIEI